MDEKADITPFRLLTWFLIARTIALIVAMSLLLTAVVLLLNHLNAPTTNETLTAVLGISFGAFSTLAGVLGNSVARDIQEFLKDWKASGGDG